MRRIKTDILQIHAEDAGFVLSQREYALEAPNYRLIDIYDLEQRLHGHLDALVCAGIEGARMSRSAAKAGRDGEGVAVLLHVALRQQRREDITFACEQLQNKADPKAALKLMGAAASWCAADVLSVVMSDWMASDNPTLRWIAFDVCGRHRVDPKTHLKTGLADSNSGVCARAMQLAGEVGRIDVADIIREQNGPVADLAMTMLGDKARAERLAAPNTFPNDPPTARRFAEVFPLAMNEKAAHDSIRALIASPRTRRWGIVALGAAGMAQSLPWLVKMMDDPLYARVAVSAFEQITGMYFAHEALELAIFPEDTDNPAIDDDACESLIEGNTPWPDPPKVRGWVDDNASRFPMGDRLLYGVAAWTFSGAPEPTMRYQARHRNIALSQAMASPQAPCPNWQSQVHLDGRQFARAW